MVQPAHAIVEAGCILVLACSDDGFLHCWYGFRMAPEIRLENCKVEKSVLIEHSIAALHGVVEISMKIVESRSVIARSPRV